MDASNMLKETALKPAVIHQTQDSDANPYHDRSVVPRSFTEPEPNAEPNNHHDPPLTTQSMKMLPHRLPVITDMKSDNICSDDVDLDPNDVDMVPHNTSPALSTIKSNESTSFSCPGLSSRYSHQSPSRGPCICVGDKVIVNKGGNLMDEHGTVMYIGYPFPDHGVRYGIKLQSAKGDNDGSIVFDIKTGKRADKRHWKRWKKRLRKRRYFTAKKNHGVFVKEKEIENITAQRTMDDDQRFTINDVVYVEHHGKGFIRFVGPFEGEQFKNMGIWYGVELDQRSKGHTHNGIIRGIKYFECSKPGHGIHCRADSLSKSNPIQTSLRSPIQTSPRSAITTSPCSPMVTSPRSPYDS